jgi:3-oxoacyl-(acyl-carrier-protein) synthase
MSTDPDGWTLNTVPGVRDTMLEALGRTDRIDAVQAHATGTPNGDEIEHDAIRQACPDVPMFSVKGKIGHTYGACGVLESIYAVMSLQHQTLPASFNADQGMPGVVTAHQHIPLRRILKNTLGFGGRCASAVIELPG